MRSYTLLTLAEFSKPGQTPTQVSLPHTWNALDGQDGGNDYYRGDGIYEISLPDPTPGKRQYIEIQGANHIATVWCNGMELGTHKGGFSTFRYELTKAMLPSGNTLKVIVNNGVCDVYPQRADFTFFGGLYRNVNFIEVEDAHFDLMKDGTDAVFATPYSNGRVRFDIFPVNAQNTTLRVQICDAEGNVVAEETAEPQEHTILHIAVPQPRLWNGVSDPYCYSAVASLEQTNETIDRVEISFGFRSFRVDAETGFYLNGKSTPLHGVCRHQDRKDMGWAISQAEHEEDMALIQEMGANTIRLAHYQHDQKFYNLCDREGMVVWAEIPFISQFMPGEDAYNNTMSQMRELIAQNYNHPSICFWGIGNELTIGGFSEALYRNLCDLNALCKAMDPSRMTTIANLGGVPIDSEHVHITDTVSYNYYLGWYSGHVADNGPRMDAFHAMHPDIPYGISEYGADHLICWHNAKPFNHDYTEEYAVYYHHELLKVFETRPYLWATHLWNMFDFAVDARNEGGIEGLNAKGMVTFDRKTKKDTFFVYKAYWTKNPMVHICGRRFADRAPDERNITVYTNEPTVTLCVNGQTIGTVQVQDHCAVFTDVPLRMGENTIAAKTTNAEDSITLNGVEEHNGAYDLPDVIDALNAGNWFLENDDEQPEEENCYNIEILSGQLVANDTCHRIIKGWIMAHEQTPLETRLGIVSRIPSCEAIWGKCKIYELPPIKKIMTQDDLNKLDKMLRRIKRT